MRKKDLAKFGDETMPGRPGQPEELAPAYVCFASQNGCYPTGGLPKTN